MSVHLTITVPVPAETIAEIKNGKKLLDSPNAPEVQADAIKAITEAAISYSDKVTPSVATTSTPANLTKTLDSDDGKFKIFVHLMTGKVIQLRVTSDFNVKKITDLLHESDDFLPHQYNLVYNGQTIYRGVLADEERNAQQLSRGLYWWMIGKNAMIHQVPSKGRS